MYIYRVGIEPGAALKAPPDFTRARKLGWGLCGQLQSSGSHVSHFVAQKQTGSGSIEFVAGDLRDWVAASSREAFEEFVGLFLLEINEGSLALE